MFSSTDIIDLVRQHAAGDRAKFVARVECMAANCEKTSLKTAQTLRRMVGQQPQSMTLMPIGGEASGMLTQEFPSIAMTDVVLAATTRERIDRLLLEQREAAKLREHGLEPARKVLFTGPPGVGKTMTAQAIATELGIGLCRVQLHAVIKSHLGETAANLAKLFDSLRGMRRVVLFDEFDAICPDRGDARDDVGEMRRTVNSLLQFIESDRTDSVIIAATNYPEVLDRAVFRRFDELIAFDLPDTSQLARLASSALGEFASGLELWAAVSTCPGISHAILVQACQQAMKDAVLAGRNRVAGVDLAAQLADRSAKQVMGNERNSHDGDHIPQGCQS